MNNPPPVKVPNTPVMRIKTSGKEIQPKHNMVTIGFHFIYADKKCVLCMDVRTLQAQNTKSCVTDGGYVKVSGLG